MDEFDRYLALLAADKNKLSAKDFSIRTELDFFMMLSKSSDLNDLLTPDQYITLRELDRQLMMKTMLSNSASH